MVTQEKKELILEILKSGRYKIVDGELHSRRGPLKGGKTPAGYKQHTIFNGKRNGKGLKCMTYAHIIIYLATYGMYDANMHIDHLDRDPSNNRPENLRAVTPLENIQNTTPQIDRVYGDWRPIRRPEIADIKRLMALGKSQAAIARELNLNRLSVRYVIKRLESGLPLKWEHSDPKYIGNYSKR